MALDNTYGLAAVHEELIKFLDEFHQFCAENNICYSLHGGTLLGAERNHHLIPWDDDLDVTMTRSQYEKFKQILPQNSLSFRLYEGSIWVPRLIKQSKEGSICIDIFIWDFISEVKFFQKIKINLLRAVQGMMKNKPDYKRFSLFYKILLATTHFFGIFLLHEKKLRLYHFIETKMFLGSGKFIHRSNDSYKATGQIFDADYMKNYCDIELEGRFYMTTTRYHEILERSYGPDYLTPPPESERVPKHMKSLKEHEEKTGGEIL